jgi:hypothetical protein
MRRRVFFVAALAVTLGIAVGSPRSTARENLPARLSDAEFWQLSADSSEPDGYFRSDTLTSNELLFQRVIPELVGRSRPDGVYLGVGPEQNFTYIAALRPPMAIIFDIRRGNMLVHLMYKALFEMAANRAEFVSMLFSKPRPPGLGLESTVTDLFFAFAPVGGDESLYQRNLSAIKTRLTKTHRLPLTPRDLDGIEYAYHAFFARGYRIRPSPSYADLMTATDKNGKQLSYLAAETAFSFVKDLETKNLVVPVVGDFAGPKAIRAVSAYLTAHGATVRAFYLSNVEQYLYQDGKWPAFCRNFSTLPLDPSSTFIRSSSGRGVGFGVGFVNSLGSIAAEARECR